MKFAGAFLLSALAVVVPVMAQSSSGSMSMTTMATTTSSSKTPQETCLSKCTLGDVNCQAACIVVPSPNEAMANRTTECAAKCSQGDGSPAATEKYAQCVQGCISSYFYTSTLAPGAASTGAATATGAAASGAAASGSRASASVSGAAATGSASGTAAAASATKTGAASNVQMAGPVLGAAGLFALAFAM